MKTTKMLTILVLALGLMVCLAQVSEAAEMGTAITYQGRLIDANSTADGLYDFQFKLFDDPCDPCDANQVGSDVNKPDVDVIDGYFTVELDFDGSAFNGDARWLEIGVRPGEMNDPNAYTVLSPRQELTPVPYALHTRGLSLTSTMNTLVGIGAGENNTGDYGTFVGQNAGYNNQGNFNTFLGSSAGRANTEGLCNTFLGRLAGYENTTGWDNTFLGVTAGRCNTEGNYNTFLGEGAGYSNQTGSGNVFIGMLAGFNETGSDKLYIANKAADPPLIYGDFSTGNVGIGTTGPAAKLEVNGEIKITDGSQGAGKVLTSDASGLASWQTAAAGGDNLGNHIATQNIRLYGHWLSGDGGNEGVFINDTGDVGIGTMSLDAKLKVSTPEWAGKAVYGEATNTEWVQNYGGYFVAKSSTGCGVFGYASNTIGNYRNFGGYFEAAGSYGNGVYAKGGPNGYAAEFRGNVIIKNRTGTDNLMELGEGLDYAEGFDVSDNKQIAAGSVLTIDADNPGKLAMSDKAYDSKVAGIVAGAKGQGSGVRLGPEQFDCDVALAGRVYCNVDATETAVQPGDLLTTSPTPGYAMKAVDYTRAQGAILGKAMEKLEKGKKGLILVLVTLQ